VKGVSIALKAKVSKTIANEESDDEESESESEMALFLKGFNKFMKKKKGQLGRGQSSRRNDFNDRKCFECEETGHIAMNCPSKKDKCMEDNKKKKFYKNKKDVQAYLVEWDSDASSDDDDDDTSSKLNAGISIKEASSLFSSPHYLMAKGGAKIKVINDLNDVVVVDDDDYDLDANGHSYDDLVKMLGEADDYMHKEKAKFRTLKELYKNLQISFEELNNCHNNLKESCEKLVEAQNSSHVHEAVLVTMDVGVTCDLLDSPTSEPHITNTICSKCNISLMNDNVVCVDSQIIVQNEVLVRKVHALTQDLEKAYSGKAKLVFILERQWCALNREGLGYVPKMGKNPFAKKDHICEGM
jgi:hypothetical protein